MASGRIAWNKGLTKETDSRIRQGWARGLTKETDPRIKLISDKLIGHSYFPSTIEKMKQNNAGKGNPMFGKTSTKKGKNFVDFYGFEKAREIQMKLSLARQGKKHSAETKEKISKSHLGKKFSDSHRLHLSVAKKGTPCKFKGLKGVPCKFKGLSLKKIFGSKRARQIKEKSSRTHKKQWRLLSEEKKREIISKLRKTYKPTYLERKTIRLCEKNNFPFNYVGDGCFWIGRFNPDFVDQERKKAIEVYSFYFKKLNFKKVKDYEVERRSQLESNGWQVLFLSNYDLDGPSWEDRSTLKINSFLNGGTDVQI